MLKFAIPNKGVLCEPTLQLLKQAGVAVVRSNENSLTAASSDGEITFLFARVQDIPAYVCAGAVDVGIAGLDNVMEDGGQAQVLCRLSYGDCRLAAAVPEGSGINEVKKLDGKTVATKMPGLTRKFLEDNGIRARVLTLSGAVELAPKLGVADAIVDQVSTGLTLQANGLTILKTVMESQACFIASDVALREKADELAALKLAFEGVRDAAGLRYLMLNVLNESQLKRVVEVLPSKESPTVLNLAKKGEYAVHSVVPQSELSGLVVRLKRAGGKDILVVPIERMIT